MRTSAASSATVLHGCNIDLSRLGRLCRCHCLHVGVGSRAGRNDLASFSIGGSNLSHGR